VKRSVALLAFMLASVCAHAEGIPPAMFGVFTTIQDEYRDIGSHTASATRVMSVCQSVASQVGTYDAARRKMTREQMRAVIDQKVADGWIASEARIARVVVDYVWTLPPAGMREAMAEEKNFYVTCRLFLDRRP